MNYERIYQNLVAASSTESVVEHHHILPRSWGGTDEKSNIVRLTPRAHYVAHKLLFRIASTQDQKFKMACALRQMAYGFCSSRAYAQIKKNWLIEHHAYMNEEIGKNGETRRELTTRKSAATMASTIVDGKTLLEKRLGKLSKNNEVAYEWEHSSGLTFTGTAFELSRAFRGQLVEPSKMMKYVNTPRYHRGWRSKTGALAKSTVEKKYSNVF